MKLRYLLVCALLVSLAPDAHAKPPKKILNKLLGIADEIDPPTVPRNPGGPELPQGPGRNPGDAPNSVDKPEGTLDNLDELEGDAVRPVSPNVPTKPPFKDVSEDPSVLPVDIDSGTDINVKEPKTVTPKPDGVDQRQQVVILPSPQEVIDFVNINAGTSLPPPTSDLTPKITLVNHSYHNEQYPPNFKIEIKVGKNEYVVGFDPSQGPGRPNFSGGHVSFPPGTVVIPKDLYNSILDGKTPDFRLSPDGNIEQLVDGKWVMYMNSHWPYGQK